MVHGSIGGEFLVSVRFLRVVVDDGRGQPAKRGVNRGLIVMRVDAVRSALFREYDRIQVLPPP